MKKETVEFLIKLRDGTEGKIYINAFVDTKIRNEKEVEAILSAKFKKGENRRKIKIAGYMIALIVILGGLSLIMMRIIL